MHDNNKDLEANKRLEERDLSDQFFSSQKNTEEESNSNKKIWFLVILFVLIGAALAWYFYGLKSDPSTEKTEAAIPKASDDSSAEKQVTSDSIANQSGSIEGAQSNQKTSDASEKVVKDNTTPVETTNESSVSNESEISTDGLHYFIISGAFSNEENAQKKISQLSKEGHKALIVGKNKAGLFMVAYDGYNNLHSARVALKGIRNTQKSAWIYKK